MEKISDATFPKNQEMPHKEINAKKLFRLPWTMADNAMTWLEPTRQCNITCDACFATNDPTSRKTLQQIEEELRIMLQLRRCDAMLIAGGEPLTHPQIIEITQIVKNYNVKPVIVTNGVGLNRYMLKDLKKAGAHGFTFHVDSHQSRPDWEGRNEKQLNELRQHFADMVYDEGNLTCAFNTTIFPDALEYVPNIVDWAIQNIDRVHILTLIAVRMIGPQWPFDFYRGDAKVNTSALAYHSETDYRNIRTWEIFQQVKKVIPDFELCAFIGGTALPHSLKWTLGCHVGISGKIFGNLGAKSMELVQNFHHFLKGSYLAYTKPSMNRRGNLLVLFGLFDSELRKTFKRYFRASLKNPSLLFKKLCTQSINILQPIDILPNGEEDTCDGCPNKTVWKGRLISACRLDDYKNFGGPLRPVPRIRGTDNAS
jgi:organic radical activating enzyme